MTNANYDKNINVYDINNFFDYKKRNDSGAPIARDNVAQVDNDDKTCSSSSRIKDYNTTNTLIDTSTTTSTTTVTSTTSNTKIMHENLLLFAGSGEVPFITF